MRNTVRTITVHNDKRYLNPGVLDPTLLGDAVIVSCVGLDTLSAQLIMQGTETWPSSCVLTLELSNDGVQFDAVPAGAVTYSAKGLQAPVTVSSVNWAKLKVSTISGTAKNIQVCWAGEGNGS